MNATFSRGAFAELEDPSPKWINPESKLSVTRQCELLKIKRSTYYYKEVIPSDDEIARTEHIMACIDRIHTQYPWAGQRRIKRFLLIEDGINIGRKLIRRLMNEMGIYTIYPKINLSKRNFKESIVPYLLRNYNAYLPNQVWSIDITYIKMNRRHMYLTAVIDWFSRKIVGWNLSDTLETTNVIDAIKKAIDKYGVPGIVNSDQGSQFTNSAYKSFLREYGIRQSMDGKSRWADNIMIERWFRSLKTELIYINEYHTPRQLKNDIRDYIKMYNSKRPHEALDYETPDAVYNSAFVSGDNPAA